MIVCVVNKSRAFLTWPAERSIICRSSVIRMSLITELHSSASMRGDVMVSLVLLRSCEQIESLHSNRSGFDLARDHSVMAHPLQCMLMITEETIWHM